MAMTIHLDVVSAEEEIFSGLGTMVFAPAEMGEVGIAPLHSPFLARLRPGEVRIRQENGEEQFFYVSGGILEVQPHVVTVLADTAYRAHDLDEAAALAAKERAEKALEDRQGDLEVATARGQLLEAMAQLRAIEKLRHQRQR